MALRLAFGPSLAVSGCMDSTFLARPLSASAGTRQQAARMRAVMTRPYMLKEIGRGHTLERRRVHRGLERETTGDDGLLLVGKDSGSFGEMASSGYWGSGRIHQKCGLGALLMKSFHFQRAGRKCHETRSAPRCEFCVIPSLASSMHAIGSLVGSAGPSKMKNDGHHLLLTALQVCHGPG
jgi:hypothetical protein